MKDVSLLFKKAWIMRISVIFVAFICPFCNNAVPEKVKNVLSEAGKNKTELEKVIRHYQESGSRQKLKAAYYLLENMSEQYHYEGALVEVFDKAFSKMDSIISMGIAIDYTEAWNQLQPRAQRRMKRVYDVKVITSEFLIENIDRSFAAWEYPWARNLSFAEFCKYILPYKLKNEKPENWKAHFQEKYKWILDSLNPNSTSMEACILINQEMSRWFYITKLNCSFDLSFSQINKIKSGRCAESTQLAAYAMRSMGIPVTLEHVPAWANRNSGHDWNGLITPNKTIPFLGTEIDPGVYKIEFPMPGSLRSKRAKIFRKTFEAQDNSLSFQVNDLNRIPGLFRNPKLEDVTRQYVPVSDIEISVKKSYLPFETVYLCIFNYLKWEPIYYAYIESDKANFSDMGRGIVYLPAVYAEGTLTPIDNPFILSDDGTITPIVPDSRKKNNIVIPRKYPVREDNEIQPGTEYELFYWDSEWVSLGRQTAIGASITYEAPGGALLWLHKIDKGIEERIFTYSNGKQIWW